MYLKSSDHRVVGLLLLAGADAVQGNGAGNLEIRGWNKCHAHGECQGADRKHDSKLERWALQMECVSTLECTEQHHFLRLHNYIQTLPRWSNQTVQSHRPIFPPPELLTWLALQNVRLHTRSCTRCYKCYCTSTHLLRAVCNRPASLAVRMRRRYVGAWHD